MKVPNEFVYAAAAIATYLVGSIPFGFVLARAVKGIDLRAAGSGNIGATNAARVLGTAWFFPILGLDLLKGFAPVFWLAPWIAERYPCGHCPILHASMAVMLGIAAVAGHLYPVWLSFKGGKGAATGVGVIFGLNWIAGAGAMAAFVTLLAATRMVSVGSMAGAIAAPIMNTFHGGRFAFDPVQKHFVTGFMVLLCVVVILRHRENIRRILKGEERRIGQPPRSTHA